MAPTEIHTINTNNNGYKSDDKQKRKMSVKVESVLTMVSSKPVNPTGKSCPLGPLDRAMGERTLHAIFYYRPCAMEFDRMRPSLNEVLTLYPKVTGRLAKDGEGNWEVKFTDTGMRVYLAKAEGSVDDWLKYACVDDEMFLAFRDDLPDDPQFWSPFRMQITEFEGGGTAIALSCPHMLADPIALTTIIKSWTDTYHRDIITHPPLLYPFALTNPPTPASATPPYWSLKSNKLKLGSPLKLGSVTFSFSDSIITQSLAQLSCNVTPFDLLTALFWSRITRLNPDDDQKENKITICMDMRKRLKAPLPSGYFGNAMYRTELSLPSRTEMDSTAPDLVGRVTEMVHRVVTDVTEEEFLSAVAWLGNGSGSSFGMYGPELTFVNMEHMMVNVGLHGSESDRQPLMYMASFDKEKDYKPIHVSYLVENGVGEGEGEGEGLILVMPAPEGRLARRVSVTLPEEDIRRLVDDEVIRGLNPTILLNGTG